MTLIFCLILFSPGDADNAYILPYSEFVYFFEEDQIEPTRKRWTGEIKNNIIRLRPSNRSMSVSQYYNAFELIDGVIVQKNNRIKEAEVFYNTDNIIDLGDLKKLVVSFNEEYQKITPYRRKRISEEIARPGMITDYIKQLNNYTCQICKEKGFKQINGTIYIEAHHIMELHKLIPGSYCSDNIIIVCANCHRKMHYAKIFLEKLDDRRILVCINENVFEFQRNIIREQ
jgi:5-methylcytosine-specific restriction endonuclease McrA